MPAKVRLIAREGIICLPVFIPLVVFSFIYINFFASIMFVGALAFSLYIFRLPNHEIPARPLAIVSPASGRLISAGPASDPWLERDAIRLQIQSSVLDIHSLRSPVEGKVMKQWQSENDHAGGEVSYWIQTDEGDDVTVSFRPGKSALFLKRPCKAGREQGRARRAGIYISPV